MDKITIKTRFPKTAFFCKKRNHTVFKLPGGMPELVLEYVLKEKGLEIGNDVEVINNIAFTSTSGAFVAASIGRS